MRQLVLMADAHLMNDPDELTDREARLQFFPWLMQRPWMPLSFVRWTIRKMRQTSLSCLERFRNDSRVQSADQLVTLGDQLHGIAERGIYGDAGRRVAQDFLERLSGIANRFPPIHVASEHPLGYWEGEDYFPHIEWSDGRPRFALPIHRDIGGRMDLDAVSNWVRYFGQLWSSTDIEDLHLVWIDCDLIRWRDRIERHPDKGFAVRPKQQDYFLEQALSSSACGSVILLCHRLSSVFASPVVMEYQDRLRATVFADFHFQKAADRAIAALPPHSFKTWFVPALWGVQFGVGKPGFATLTIDGDQASFQQHRLV